MGEARRKRQAAPSPAERDDALRVGIQQVHTEGAGVIGIHIVAPDDGPRLVIAALSGHTLAAYLLNVVAQSIGQIVEAPKHAPVLCVNCPAPIRSSAGVTFGVTLPDIEQPSTGLAFAICRHCAVNPAKAAMEGLRRIWPDSRPITHMHGGRA